MRNPDPYKGPWGGKACRDSPVQADRSCDCQPGECQACTEYVKEIKDALTFCSPKDKMGGFFAESIQVGKCKMMQNLCYPCVLQCL